MVMSIETCYISINKSFFQELSFHENTYRDIYFPRDPEESFENASSCPQKSRRKLLTYKVSIWLFKSKHDYLQRSIKNLL